LKALLLIFLVDFVAAFPWLLAAGAGLVFMLVSVLATFYAERKVSAFMQDRVGPLQQGPYGLLQAVADVLKLIQKGDTLPALANKPLFFLAPWVVFGAVFAGFAIMPLWPSQLAAPVGAGLFFMLAVVALDVAGIWMAGWGSHSKYPLLGAMRAVSQMLSYEVPLGLSVLCVVAWSGTLDPNVLSAVQSISPSPTYLLGSEALGLQVNETGGLFTWNILQVPWFLPLYLVYYIATLAACNRAPFDLPEGESELVGGFHTEYSGFRFAVFFLAEYALMVLVSLAGIFLFLGGWNTPLPNLGPVRLADWTSGTQPAWAFFWIMLKTWAILFSHVWVRWTLPRLRIDQLMHLGWKYMTPAALFMLLATLAWKAF